MCKFVHLNVLEFPPRYSESKKLLICLLVSTESVDADHCGINQCEHSGVCIPNNNTAGYTCKCTEEYDGPFCEEFLGKIYLSQFSRSTSALQNVIYAALYIYSTYIHETTQPSVAPCKQYRLITRTAS